MIESQTVPAVSPEPATDTEPIREPPGMTLDRRNRSAQRIVREQRDATAQSRKWKPVDHRLNWQESLCLALVRGLGKANVKGLATITGLSEAEAEAATYRLWRSDYIKTKSYAAGTFYVPFESPSI